jgi:hypothetical protein
VGRVFGTEPGRTWIRLRELSAARYAEDGGESGAFFPVFVTVLKARLPRGEELEREVRDLAKEIGSACRRSPENVHILYEPPAAGRIAFGGTLLPAVPAEDEARDDRNRGEET